MTTHAATHIDFVESRTSTKPSLIARIFQHMIRAREAEARRRVRYYLSDHALAEVERAGIDRDSLGI